MYNRPGKVKYAKREEMKTRVLFVSRREKRGSEEWCHMWKEPVNYTFPAWERRLVVRVFWFSFRGRKKEMLRLLFPLHIWIKYLHSPKTSQQKQSLMLRSLFKGMPSLSEHRTEDWSSTSYGCLLHIYFNISSFTWICMWLYWLWGQSRNTSGSAILYIYCL